MKTHSEQGCWCEMGRHIIRTLPDAVPDPDRGPERIAFVPLFERYPNVIAESSDIDGVMVVDRRYTAQDPGEEDI